MRPRGRIVVGGVEMDGEDGWARGEEETYDSSPIAGTLDVRPTGLRQRDPGEQRALDIANGRNVDHELATLIAIVCFLAVLTGAIFAMLVIGSDG